MPLPRSTVNRIKPALLIGVVVLSMTNCTDRQQASPIKQSLTSSDNPIEVETKATTNVHGTEIPSDEDLRKEIGLPEGWSASIARQRHVTTDGNQSRRVILQIQSLDEMAQHRLALGSSQDDGSLAVEIENVCSEGFTTYCERNFDQVPTPEDVDKFATDYQF